MSICSNIIGTMEESALYNVNYRDILCMLTTVASKAPSYTGSKAKTANSHASTKYNVHVRSKQARDSKQLSQHALSTDLCYMHM